MTPIARRAAMTSCLAALVLSTTVTPAAATFPGAEGKIALETRGLGASTRGIWVTGPTGIGLEQVVGRGASPAWSASGRKITFSDDRNGTGDIFTVAARGREVFRLTSSGADDLDPTWSPGGASIAFARRTPEGTAIYITDSTGTDVDAVAGTAGGRQPSWSPDGDLLAFAAPGPTGSSIKVVELSTGQVTPVTTGADDDNPSWSPNGQRLAFERTSPDGNTDVFVVDRQGTGLDRVTSSPAPDVSPVWSPSGGKVAYLAQRDQPGIFVKDLSTGDAQRLKTVRATQMDWQACPGLAECPGGPVTRVDTHLKMAYDKLQRRIEVSGRLRPRGAGDEVKVTLLRKRGGSFRRVASKRPDVGARGRYETSFRRPRGGRCKLVASFARNDNYASSMSSKIFFCALPLHLATYSPEQLPRNTERALERIGGVKATTVWSGSKFMKSSRASGRIVDNPPGSYKIPLDVAFVEPREFAAFARPADRDAIRSLDGNKALLSEGEVGLRKGHRRLRMRFSVGRARSVGSISNNSAQGYEVILAQPAPRASVAFRVVLIEKPPGVARKRIARKLRRLVGSGTPLELSSEKEVPYLRHAQLVRPQLFVKKAFGEFSMRPTSGRSIAIGGRWVARNIRTDGVPILGRVTCHGKIFRQLRGAMRELRRKGLGHTATRSNYAGCFNPRFISSYTGSRVGPVKRLSRHAWGIALDINAGTNPFGRRPRQDRRFVKIMRKWGFTWGGRWSLPDGMHFEWERFP